MVASMTTVPVIGVPVKLKTLEGIDSLLSVVQMPKEIVVATVAINNSYNAAILAVEILSINDDVFNRSKFGKSSAIIEEYLVGDEFSLKYKFSRGH